MIKINECVLARTAYGVDGFLKDRLKKIVFAGRSNVGKSSMINSLLNRRSLAQVSSTPGKTRSVNYYLINGSFYLVDLPGYGFAKVRDEEKQKWSLLMEEFFSREKYVTLLGLLIDSQVGPTPFDENMLGAASLYKLPTLLIATKCDKLNNDEKKQRSRRWEGETGVPVLPYSSKSGEGRRELWQTIENILEDRNP
ncbi:MAG TPA: ribosome biogenesis GTP-binding protein YihA/YsxC [Candidatus Aminicenantes bacterium]|nr:ribosome biogenesis GTP-binding protein YihA/YsxC [Candidatus Aminicenantes bacterium]HPB54763.1 ribosome biogenesis GTP-binding protein YihA/YsxC [Candidatus Aminicenantes bacterium]HPS99539.1 ribosome biogenesis GTP-binding protein YihA/YsxC [Candidatus Aminicenantes bacterium]